MFINASCGQNKSTNLPTTTDSVQRQPELYSALNIKIYFFFFFKVGVTKAGFHGLPISNFWENFPIKIMKGKEKKKVAKCPVCLTAH